MCIGAETDYVFVEYLGVQEMLKFKEKRWKEICKKHKYTMPMYVVGILLMVSDSSYKFCLM